MLCEPTKLVTNLANEVNSDYYCFPEQLNMQRNLLLGVQIACTSKKFGGQQ
jgi:hypothetical protein